MKEGYLWKQNQESRNEGKMFRLKVLFYCFPAIWRCSNRQGGVRFITKCWWLQILEEDITYSRSCHTYLSSSNHKNYTVVFMNVWRQQHGMCLDRFLCSSDELYSWLFALFGYFAAGRALLSQSLCCLVYYFLLSTFTPEAKLLTTDGQNYCQRAVEKGRSWAYFKVWFFSRPRHSSRSLVSTLFPLCCWERERTF